MRVAVTGTPGTGKTTATEHLDTGLDIVHLNDVIQAEDLYTEVDEARDSKVADLDAVRDWLEGREDVLVESHLSHLLDADRVVVLRCAPGELERRLIERGEPAEKAEENAESEALDVILSEAVRDHGKPNVYEIDTTDRDPEAVADDVAAVLAGERDPSAGEVDFTEYL
ncbi:adenylate kinase family protein [Halobacterium noricense]|uniref:adenylate kinase family protein n=1 Tax=Halobacterium noricense TaxID=223182 RepID=UPI001E57BB41|nr:adenylate kinase family protein [Halobacterium noricense]UHH26497.1 adenylate kinase family protein [Halobacterium noricense]